MNSPHLKRWLSGLVMAPTLVLFTLLAPPWVFLLLILGLTWIGLREFYGLALPEVARPQKNAAWALGLLVPLAFFSGGLNFFPGLAVLFLFMIFLFALAGGDEFEVRVNRLGKHLLGFFYVPVLLAHFVLLRPLQDGALWVLFTLVAVFFGDTTAFYVGRAWGRRKLAPAISPGKTVAGGAGALLGSLAGAMLYGFFFLPKVHLLHAAALGAGIGGIGQLGDLCESLLKRGAAVKDSGTLIPGHGGLLDRIDSVLFSAPFVYYYLQAAGID